MSPPRSDDRGQPPAGKLASNVISDTTTGNSTAYVRRRWAYRYISRVSTPDVTYGSPQWCSMPEGPEKWGIAIRAAEAFASMGDTLVEDLRVEVEQLQLAHKQAEDADYQARRDAHRVAWDPRSGGFRPDPRIATEIEAEWAEWMSGGAE